MRLWKGFAGTARVSKASYKAIAVMVLVLASSIFGICGSAQENVLDYAPSHDLSSSQSTINPFGMETNIAPAVPETLEDATLVLTKPRPFDLIPYTKRCFDDSTVAAIAWWMNPKFADNTTEYRNYLRATPENRSRLYSPETRIFFDFITKHLDMAISESALKENLILYRGINANVAAKVINNSEYIEPAYASTAYDITLSLGIFATRSPDGYTNVLVLQRPGGKHVLYINEDEREFLLPRDLKWDVIKAINIENLTVMADFPLFSSRSNEAQFNKVRLMYIREKNE
jgi:hypothetical protein